MSIHVTARVYDSKVGETLCKVFFVSFEQAIHVYSFSHHMLIMFSSDMTGPGQLCS